MRSAVGRRRPEEMDDVEDNKWRRKSYALAQHNAPLPIPLPPVEYPPPRATPVPPAKTIFRPVSRGYRPPPVSRPQRRGNGLPAMPEAPSEAPNWFPQSTEPAGILAPTAELGTIQENHNSPVLSTFRPPKPENPQTATHPSSRGAPPPLPTNPPRSLRAKQPPPPPVRAVPPPLPISPQSQPIAPPVLPTNPPPIPGSPPPPLTNTPPTPRNDPLSLSTAPSTSTDLLPLESDSTTLPPTPTSQRHYPPTPPSLSRSDTPTSLGCPRTPPSIRAAPWQPPFLPAHTSRAPTTTPTPPPDIPATPSPTPNGESNIFPPTPPSSPSQAQGTIDEVTPASSINSLNQAVANKSPPTATNPELAKEKLQANSNSSLDDVSTSKTNSSYPAVLDVTDLTSDVPDKGSVTSNSEVPEVTLVNGNFHNNNINLDAFKVDTQGQNGNYIAYRTRFWILAIFSLVAFIQCMVWGTFGSIADSAEAAFPSWTDGTIAAFPNWGPIIVVVFTIPMMWLTQKLGLRLGMIVCASLITAGTLMRIFTSEEKAFTILCHVGAILNSFAACVTLSLPAMVSATWFPPHERTTATAVGSLMCQLGGAAVYLGPLVVRSPHEGTPTEDIRGDIMILMYIHFGMAAALLVAVVVYFPASPPTPPSASSAQEKIDFISGIKSIVRNKQLLLLLCVYSFSFGIPVVWIGVLYLSLRPLHVDQNQAVGVVVTAVVCSGVAAFITAAVTDKMYGQLKLTVMSLLAASTAFFMWFLLMSTKVIYPSLAQVYIAVSGSIAAEYATVPLLVELAVEVGYPVPESVVGASLTFLFNIVSLVFLAFFQIPSSDYLWVSFVLLGCVSLTIVPLLFVKETHKRSRTDGKDA